METDSAYFSGKHYEKYFLRKGKPNCETISVAFPSLGNTLQLLLMLCFWQANVIFKYHRRNAESEFTQEDEHSAQGLVYRSVRTSSPTFSSAISIDCRDCFGSQQRQQVCLSGKTRICNSSQNQVLVKNTLIKSSAAHQIDRQK